MPDSSERAKKEQKRRDGERGLFEELSRYYPLDRNSGQVEWERPSLLKEGKRTPNTSSRKRHPLTCVLPVLEDLKVHHPPAALANVPTP